MLDKITLKNTIRGILDYEATQEDHPEDSRDRFATQIADAIDNYVKGGLVTVNTTGTSSAQHGTGNIT